MLTYDEPVHHDHSYWEPYVERYSPEHLRLIRAALTSYIHSRPDLYPYAVAYTRLFSRESVWEVALRSGPKTQELVGD